MIYLSQDPSKVIYFSVQNYRPSLLDTYLNEVPTREKVLPELSSDFVIYEINGIVNVRGIVLGRNLFWFIIQLEYLMLLACDIQRNMLLFST